MTDIHEVDWRTCPSCKEDHPWRAEDSRAFVVCRFCAVKDAAKTAVALATAGQGTGFGNQGGEEMKTTQRDFFIWMGITVGIVLFAVLIAYIFVDAVRPLALQIEESGLKGIVENIWCGENGCEQGGKR